MQSDNLSSKISRVDQALGSSAGPMRVPAITRTHPPAPGSKDVFRFLPGEKVEWIVGMPGPDTDDCTIISDDGGDTVKIRYQVYGKGRFFTETVKRDRIMWRKDSETSRRYHEWRQGNAE